MAELNESRMKLLKRIKSNAMLDGDYDDLMEYLKELSEDNYKAFKNHGAEMNDIHKGYALCVDFIIECFANCDKEVKISEQDQLGQEAFS
jgi:hypothetical protein